MGLVDFQSKAENTNPIFRGEELLSTMNVVRNNKCQFRYAKFYYGGFTFLFDKRGCDFFAQYCNDTLMVKDGYLARFSNENIEYFHREFQMYLFSFQPSLVVHHKNQRKYDNRNSNLQILSSAEHDQLHEEKRENKYKKKGEVMQARYEKRRERAIEKYIERGIRMQACYEVKGRRMRTRRYK